MSDIINTKPDLSMKPDLGTKKKAPEQEKEAEKRALRDRVRASTMVTVPAHVAASVEASSKSSTSVLGNPFSVVHSSQRPAPRARALVDGSVEC